MWENFLDDFDKNIDYMDYFTKYNLNKDYQIEWIKNIDNALNELKKNDIFNMLYWNITLDDILPIAIKESFLNSNAKNSKSWAVWYFQLKQEAFIHAKTKLESWWIRRWLDVYSPLDNSILWIAYILMSKEMVWKRLSLKNYPDEFNIFAYNWWAWNLKYIFEEYKKENLNNLNNLTWDKFAFWLSWKIDMNNNPKIVYSKDYKTNYKNWFSQDFSNDSSEIFFSWVPIRKSKIYEMINYVEKINWIKKAQIIIWTNSSLNLLSLNIWISDVNNYDKTNISKWNS